MLKQWALELLDLQVILILWLRLHHQGQTKHTLQEIRLPNIHIYKKKYKGAPKLIRTTLGKGFSNTSTLTILHNLIIIIIWAPPPPREGGGNESTVPVRTLNKRKSSPLVGNQVANWPFKSGPQIPVIYERFKSQILSHFPAPMKPSQWGMHCIL